LLGSNGFKVVLSPSHQSLLRFINFARDWLRLMIYLHHSLCLTRTVGARKSCLACYHWLHAFDGTRVRFCVNGHSIQHNLDFWLVLGLDSGRSTYDVLIFCIICLGQPTLVWIHGVKFMSPIFVMNFPPF